MDHNANVLEMIAKMSRLMRRHKEGEDSLPYMSHYLLRMIMMNDGIRAAELAELTNTRPSSITEAINRLEKQGYVVRKKDDGDSRVKRIYITEKTRDQIEEHTKAKMERNNRVRSCLTDEEITAFMGICEKLCTFMESEEYGNLP